MVRYKARIAAKDKKEAYERCWEIYHREYRIGRYPRLLKDYNELKLYEFDLIDENPSK